MHDVTPLGTLMHLKELDRQAALRRRPLGLARQSDPGTMPSSAIVIAFLRRLRAAGLPWRLARQD
jgi:hypothetical protein